MEEQSIIAENMLIADLCLYLEKSRALVVADLHLGYEEMLNKQGIMIPRANYDEIKKRIERAFSELKAKRKKIEVIIVNGDFKHEFGAPSQQEWKEVLDMLEFLQAHCGEIILIKGNHDNILGPIARWKGIKIVDEFFAEHEKALIFHGDKAIDETSENYKNAETLIIAHEHCAVTLREGAKAEKYRCFLKGNYDGKILIAQPAISAIAEGSDVSKQIPLSPYLQSDLSEFEVFIVEDKVYYFGRLKNILQ